MPSVEFLYKENLLNPASSKFVGNHDNLPCVAYAMTPLGSTPRHPKVYDHSLFDRIQYNWEKSDIFYCYGAFGRPDIMDLNLRNPPKVTPKLLKIKGLSYCDETGDNIFYYQTLDQRDDPEMAPSHFRHNEYSELTRYLLNLLSIRNAPFEFVLEDHLDSGWKLIYAGIYPYRTFDIDNYMDKPDNKLDEFLLWIEETVYNFELQTLI